jgi:hypothetical protein
MSTARALNGHATAPHPDASDSPDTVKATLTPNRAPKLVENDEYAAFARRVLRAYARRVATGDVEALTLMLGLSAAAFVLGGLYAVAVAGSRVYLADHYPPDVIGGMLCAVAAAFIVTGLAALPALQPLLRRLDAPKASTAEASGRS